MQLSSSRQSVITSRHGHSESQVRFPSFERVIGRNGHLRSVRVQNLLNEDLASLAVGRNRCRIRFVGRQAAATAAAESVASVVGAQRLKQLNSYNELLNIHKCIK